LTVTGKCVREKLERAGMTSPRTSLTNHRQVVYKTAAVAPVRPRSIRRLGVFLRILAGRRDRVRGKHLALQLPQARLYLGARLRTDAGVVRVPERVHADGQRALGC